MYCRKCGAPNENNAFACKACGNVLNEGAVAQPPRAIPNYLAQSILVSLFCCLPLGIPAIVFASQVNAKAKAGDIEGAMESSRKAKLWVWWSFGVGFVGVILYTAFNVLLMNSGALQSPSN